MTQREVAAEVGVSVGTVTAWEIGKQRPEGRNLERLAAFLGVFPDEITSAAAGLAEPGLPPALARLLVREPRPAPNYAGLGIDLPGYGALLDGPRRLFDAFMLDLIRRGLGREELEVVDATTLRVSAQPSFGPAGELVPLERDAAGLIVSLRLGGVTSRPIDDYRRRRTAIRGAS